MTASLPDILDPDRPRNTPQRVTELEQAKREHVQHGGKETDFYTAANELILHRRQEALTAGQTNQADYLGEILIELNRGIVIDYCAKFATYKRANYGDDTDDQDLQADGLLGLWEAATTYEPGRGSFSKWAHMVVRRRVLRAVQAIDHKTISRDDFYARKAVQAAQKQLTTETHTPTIREIAEHAHVTPGVAKRVLNPPELHTIEGVAEQDTGHTDPTADIVEQHATQAAIQHLVDQLEDTQHRYVLEARYGLNGEPEQTLADIGRHIGMSREGVRQIHNKALAKLAGPEAWHLLHPDEPESDTA